MAVTVRRIRSDEGPVLKQVRLAALLDEPSAFAKTHAEEAAYPDEEWRGRATAWSSGDDGATFFAELDGEIVGLVGSHRSTHIELVSMWVDAAVRGQGVADALVAAVVDWAAGDDVELWVTRGNDRAYAFYSRLGFQETGDAQPLPSDPCKNEIRMRRAIGNRPAT